MVKDPCDAELIAYLEKSDSQLWHQVALNWNWDACNDVLEWIINQPNCNKGTALLIYWCGGPRYYGQYQNRTEVDELLRDNYDLMKSIESKYLNGFYLNDKVYFDPHSHDDIDWTKEYESDDRYNIIPPIMYQPTGSEKIEKIYLEEGYPKEVLDIIKQKGLLDDR